MKTIFITCICLIVMGSLTSAAAKATPIRTPNRISILMYAKTRSDLESLRTSARELEKNQALCRAQLKRKKLPSSCFQVIQLEDKAGLINRTKKAETLRWLSDRCEQIASKTKDLAELNQALQLKSLSPSCEERLAERMEDLKYVAEDEAPEALFAAHLN